MTILVTGGAGYIGSAIVIFLAQKGYNVVMLDHNPDIPAAVKQHATACFINDFADQITLHTIFSKYTIDAVIHCAAFIEVGESVNNPHRYYENNVTKTTLLLKSMLEHDVKKIIFSSSCAVYGTPEKLPLTEDHHKKPLSPYGTTKLMVEYILADYARAYGLQYVALRYFNAAGGLPAYNLFECHQPETHLIPRIINALTIDEDFTIYGNNYPTPDGTCIRDFLHIWDLADAHHKSLLYLQANGTSQAFNLGTGTGYSVQQVITALENYTEQTLKVTILPRREGDPALLVADATQAQNKLKWYPTHSSLEEIIKSSLHKQKVLQKEHISSIAI